jgi:hypothetical protein
MDWIHLARDWNEWRALVNTLMDIRVKLEKISKANLLTGCGSL